MGNDIHVVPCSRSARPQKGLARRAQLANMNAIPRESETGKLGGNIIGTWSHNVRSEGQSGRVPVKLSHKSIAILSGC